MIAALCLAALAAPQDYEVAPRLVAWEALSPGFFDRAWTLPEERAAGRDLLAEMRVLAELSIGEGEEAVAFGDLVAQARAIGREERAAWLDAFLARAPDAASAWGAQLRELLHDDFLFSDAWEPANDHPRDGILMAEGWEPSDDAPAPWRGLPVTPRFEQAAALFHADLATIKDVENDYRTYPEHVGSDYEEIFPFENGHLRGEDASGRPFRFVAIYSRSDLPFPFSDYTCELRILHRIDAEGLLRTDIYSPSPDFHFLAGRDVFLPVEDSRGAVVAYLLVRDFGFDIDDVPDRAKHRQEAMRSTIGNLKRKAELRDRGPRPSPGTPDDVLTAIRVLGSKRR